LIKILKQGFEGIVFREIVEDIGNRTKKVLIKETIKLYCENGYQIISTGYDNILQSG
jgi:hypothetical protein